MTILEDKKTKVLYPTDDFDIFDIISDNEDNAEDEMIKSQIHTDVRKASIEKLPEDQREVLKMRYYKDLSFKEISEITNVSINTALR